MFNERWPCQVELNLGDVYSPEMYLLLAEAPDWVKAIIAKLLTPPTSEAAQELLDLEAQIFGEPRTPIPTPEPQYPFRDETIDFGDGGAASTQMVVSFLVYSSHELLEVVQWANAHQLKPNFPEPPDTGTFNELSPGGPVPN